MRNIPEIDVMKFRENRIFAQESLKAKKKKVGFQKLMFLEKLKFVS